MSTFSKALALALGAVCASGVSLAQNATTAAPLFEKSTEKTSPYVMVVFEEAGLLNNTGQFRGMAATAPAATGSRKLQANSTAAKAYREALSEQRGTYLNAISAKLQRRVKAAYEYDITMNAVALALSDADAALLKGIPGVVSISRVGMYEINTDAGPNWINAPAVWDGSATPTGTGTKGQGVTVGVFDSGSNSTHPSFANSASCGFNDANPKLTAARDCESNTPGTPIAYCTGPAPEDLSTASSGHGVHTASTAAGNELTPPLTVGGVELKWRVSGVAPCAKVITYRVCGTNTCDGTWIQSAIERSIVDQVDVVNFSISGGANPWLDNDRGFLNMVNADIFVAASAGNTRAAPNDNPIGTVNHRGPWVMTVANSTHDRVEANSISLAGSLQNQPGAPTTPSLAATTTADLVTGASLGNNFGCTDTGAFPAGSMTGKIALIQRGPLNGATPSCTFVEKMQNAANAGAIAAVIFNHSPGPLVNMAAGAVPGFFVTKGTGDAWVAAANATSQMTINIPAQRLTDPNFGDILNAGSLRGPNIVGATTVGTNNYTGTDTTKPDITAPGTNIYAATGVNTGQFGFLTGTSMSSPHVAGAAALVRSANPSWTVSETKSALMLTANRAQLRPDGITRANPDDLGTGRVDLRRAALAGLVMDETFANYLAAQPANDADQGRVRALNLASYRNTDCTAGVCTFTRTFRNTRTVPTTWVVDTTGAPAGTTIVANPATFSFGGGLTQTQSVVFTVRITQAGGLPLPTTAPRSPAFGAITLSPRLNFAAPPAGTIMASGFEDPPLGQPLVVTVGIAGPQAP
jgi:subtilisin family serine protease